jgi:sulfur carrier protein
MNVTVEVAGEDTHEVTVAEDATYADLLGPLELSPHEVSIVVDDRTVPSDHPVESDHVRVVRLIKGG